ncbi:hypothetical protein [Pseudoroseomonas cervicalis]|uniref:hypothetical protein n=1 Tax=Teichococcus cervicalis TaxID=204525 RepID=UPI0022F18B79|nr:hypothetical protein [Pseudoroseomonas cervicalis]WBV43071.1 hypothetical protein PFY06_00435 [Pseudoroseomonas cervicalis]
MVLPRRLLLGAALLAPLTAAAQKRPGPARMAEPPPVAIPTLPPTASSAEGFVPPGWRLEASAQGDLDEDGRPDLAMVLRAQDPANILDNPGLGEPRLDTNPRLLAIAFGTPDGYRLALQDASLIPRRTDPRFEDPFEAETLRIARFTLRLGLGLWANAGSWGAERRDFTFRWQNGGFELIGFDLTETNRASGESRALSVNLSTSHAIIREGDPVRERRVVLHQRPLPRLGAVGSGLNYDPAVPGWDQ